MTTVFYRDGVVVWAEAIREELRDGAVDAGVPQDVADALFAGALVGDAADCAMIEDLIPGLECVTDIGFGEPDAG
jgi:hypothetical protein